MPKIATYNDEKLKSDIRFTVDGGLHYIRGNSAPYFTLTASGYENGSGFGGCCHDIILKYFPQFSDLAALHLSDIDGAPMYALENGFYHLGGCRHDHLIGDKCPLKIDVAAKHFRVSEDIIRSDVLPLFGDSFSEIAGFLSKGAAAQAKARLAIWVESQKPRWKQEALDCIAKHNLVVYGDEWKGGTNDRQS